MSTIYDFNEDDYINAISNHYFDDGWDIAGFVEDGETEVYEASRGFKARDVQTVQDVFIGEVFAHIVCELDGALAIFTMTRSHFKTKWSKRVWAKFRDDNKVTCPLCGKKKAEFCNGATYMERLEQYYCENCHEAYVTNAYGKFMRKGTLSEPIDPRDYW